MKPAISEHMRKCQYCHDDLALKNLSALDILSMSTEDAGKINQWRNLP